MAINKAATCSSGTVAGYVSVDQPADLLVRQLAPSRLARTRSTASNRGAGWPVSVTA